MGEEPSTCDRYIAKRVYRRIEKFGQSCLLQTRWHAGPWDFWVPAFYFSLRPYCTSFRRPVVLASFPGMVRKDSNVSVCKRKTGCESSHLRRGQSSGSSFKGVLLPGRRRLLKRGTSPWSDSEETEGPLRRTGPSVSLVFPEIGLRKRSFSSVAHSEDLMGSVPEVLTDDVIYVKTARV